MPSQTSTLYFLALALAATTSAIAIPVEATSTTTGITPTPTTTVVSSSSTVAAATPPSLDNVLTEVLNWKWATAALDLMKSNIKGKEDGSNIKEEENISAPSSIETPALVVPTISNTFSTLATPVPSSSAIAAPTLTLTHDTSAKAVPTDEAVAWNWALPALKLIESRELGDSTSFANRRTGDRADKVDTPYVVEDKNEQDSEHLRLDEAAKQSIRQAEPPSLPLQTASPSMEEQVKPTKVKADFTIQTETRLFKTMATPAIEARSPTPMTMEPEPTPTAKSKAEFTIQTQTSLFKTVTTPTTKAQMPAATIAMEA
ncbi:hypothetical protein COL5a_003124 [Colletotrichum fioriniae]|uniref:uncharacterized protein n=1 Tax=Colletotrichum fioriniae TaxID=710243 RepID=UPI0022FFD81F|nr:uncharacterized protein COL516b_010805 [Colletotrichum fioriniae]KAJ0297388.1 hypothetical protein COL516b_010805 [Colletotrichum fioriniae]KAJ0330820.1 hypothetical protein COL5a_003124 [Colletotrichum fioriniae]KAJ3945208.1 hypothetical protein N0V96_005234 [Colletotrichum fioriniae]